MSVELKVDLFLVGLVAGYLAHRELMQWLSWRRVQRHLAVMGVG